MKKIHVILLALMFALTAACGTPKSLPESQDPAVLYCPADPPESLMEASNPASTPGTPLSDEMFTLVESAVTEHCKAEIDLADIQAENCLRLILTEENPADITMFSLDMLSIRLKEIAAALGVQQCFVTVRDPSETIMLRMTGDLSTGSTSTWANPDYQDILVDVGPAPAPEESALDFPSAAPE